MVTIGWAITGVAIRTVAAAIRSFFIGAILRLLFARSFRARQAIVQTDNKAVLV
jgi:hypothetical protein